MTRHRLTLILVLFLLVTSFVAADQAGNGQKIAVAPGNSSHSADRMASPGAHDVERDGPVFMARDQTGRLWAVWSYRTGLNVDIAVSRAIGDTWTNPVLVGEANGAADLDPRLQFLPDGTGLLVWWQRPDDGSWNDRVVMAQQVGDSWTGPVQVSPSGQSANRPSVFVSASGSTAIGFVVTPEDGGPSSIQLTTVATMSSTGPNGGSNGPDPIPTVNHRHWDEDTKWWPDPLTP